MHEFVQLFINWVLLWLAADSLVGLQSRSGWKFLQSNYFTPGPVLFWSWSVSVSHLMCSISRCTSFLRDVVWRKPAKESSRRWWSGPWPQRDSQCHQSGSRSAILLLLTFLLFTFLLFTFLLFTFFLLVLVLLLIILPFVVLILVFLVVLLVLLFLPLSSCFLSLFSS